MKRPGGTDRIWAPWRMTFLKKARKGGRSTACFFCDYARRRKQDRKNLVLLRGRSCMVVLNLYPYTTGHLMVAPLAHKGNLAAFTAEERAELFDLLVRSQKAIDRALRPHGYNVGFNLGQAAGAGVPGHAHLHIVPRWVGDSNFMTTVGNARVIPESLQKVFADLQKALRKGR